MNIPEGYSKWEFYYVAFIVTPIIFIGLPIFFYVVVHPATCMIYGFIWIALFLCTFPFNQPNKSKRPTVDRCSG